MNLLENSHVIKMSNSKEDVIITRIQSEKLALLLASPKKPQFININSNILNTSFIVGIFERVNLEGEGETRKLTEEEKQIHQSYLNYIKGRVKLK